MIDLGGILWWGWTSSRLGVSDKTLHNRSELIASGSEGNLTSSMGPSRGVIHFQWYVVLHMVGMAANVYLKLGAITC
jgi:hypothetical protein